MVELPNRVVGDAYSNQFAWRLLERLAEIGSRMPGQEGEAQGAQVMKEGFEEINARDIEINEFEIPGWWRGTSSLTIQAPQKKSFEADYQIVSLVGSPSETVNGEIVNIGAGLPENFRSVDLEEKIAFVSTQTPRGYSRGINRIEKYTRAEDAGAVGFILHNENVNGQVPPTGTVGFNRLPGGIPAVGVSNEVGSYITRYLEKGTVNADISVKCENEPATCRNIEAIIGPESDSEIIVTGHIDGHDIGDGVRDNGVGSVLAAEVGRQLSHIGDELDSQIRMIAFGGEETGLYGSYHWAETNELDNVKCQINIDGAGYSRDLMVTGTQTVGEVFKEAADYLETPIEFDSAVTLGPFSDQWPFYKEGVPSVTCRSSADQWPVRYGNVEWGHTHADTLDKIDSRDLRELGIQIAAGVAKLSRNDINPPHKSKSDIQEALPEPVHEYLEMSGRDEW